MPRNTREWAMRKVDMASGNLEVSRRHLTEVIETYIDPHPEVAHPLVVAFEAIQEIEALLRKAREF